jgi:hypothetical protein
LPAATKNALLRVTVKVSGRAGHPVAIVLGEVDPNFGNHPALIALSEDGKSLPRGPELVFPGDHGTRRTVAAVSDLTVSVANPMVPAGVQPGSLVVSDGHRVVTLTAQQIARLPMRTLTVTFLAGTAPQTDTETGPTLAAVLRAARIGRTATTTVAASAAMTTWPP